jgi:cardiolipin synthase
MPSNPHRGAILQTGNCARKTMGERKHYWKMPLRFWLLTGLVFVLAAVVISFVFLRRSTVNYAVPHAFTVDSPTFFASAHALADPIPIEGNKITLLHNGDQTFTAMLEAIAAAKQSVNFDAFLFSSGHVGSQFIDAFTKKAKEGVRVRVLLDAVGSGNLEDADVERLRHAGCSFAYYHPTWSWQIHTFNRRSHRRILVVDGRIGFTGGIGFSDEWRGNADSPDHWRDVHAQLEGPIVARLQSEFQQLWIKATGETISGSGEFPVLEPAGTLKAQVVPSHGFTVTPLTLVQAVAFSSAVKSIYITNAYCAPSESQTQALVEAVKRGVDVRLLLPGRHNDQPMTKAAGRTAYGKLLEGGVKIYEYEPTMIHSKTMVVDGLFSIVGSSNFDARSAEINEELDVTVYDAAFGQQMIEVFMEDLEKSRPYTLEEFRKRSLKERLSEWIALPFHSQI